MSENPLVSVVIANYNYGRFLPDALASIMSQEKLDEFEILIVDAASTDDSVSIVKSYAGSELRVVDSHGSLWHECERLKWLSEPDKGQSDAFNKGFSVARGRYFTWLNADEMYAPETFSAIVEFIRRNPSAQWITSNDISFSDETKKIVSLCWGPHFLPSVFTATRIPPVVFGPSSFFSRDAFLKAGGVDVNLKYGMDTDLWRRFLQMGYRQYRLNRFCWVFRRHCASKTFGTATTSVELEKAGERAYLRQKHVASHRKSFLNPYYVLWILFRVLDGSLLLRYFKRKQYLGKSINIVMERQS